MRRNNAMAQTGWKGGLLTPENWKEKVRLQLLDMDWKNLQEDVRPFIEPGFDLNLLTKENLERLLKD